MTSQEIQEKAIKEYKDSIRRRGGFQGKILVFTL